MEGEENFVCKHCNVDFSLREYAVHQMTNTHLKRLKRELLEKEFAAVCRACNCSLQNLKMVEVHVQQGSHLEKVNAFSTCSFLSTSKFTCKLCAVAFYNEIAMEVHRLVHSNGLVLDLSHFTSLSELAKQLGGLPEESTLSFTSPACVVCNTVFDHLDELTLHLVSDKHFFRLRSSSCILCKKEFNHVSDRETHLAALKHKMMVDKCENFLEQGQIQLAEQKGGYLCMYCMVWCHSWYSLKLHILDSSHHKTAVRVRKALIPANWKLKYGLSTDAQCQGDSHCDALAAINWKKWRDEPGESVWCHRCGMILPGPDAASAHLKEHGIFTNPFVSKMHNLRCSDTIHFPGLFECSYCLLSFKSAFLLSIHEVYYEHHQSISMVNNASILNCCAKCGLLVAMDKENLSVSAHENINALSSGAHPSKTCLEVLDYEVLPLKHMNGESCPERNLVSNSTGQLSDGEVLHATCGEISQAGLQVQKHGLQFVTNRDDVMKMINQQMPDGGPLVLGDNSCKVQKDLTGPCHPTVASNKNVEGMNIKQDLTRLLHGQGPPCTMLDTVNCRVGSSQGFELHGLLAQSGYDKGHLTPKDNCTGESLNVVNLSQVHATPLSCGPLIGKDNCFQEGSKQGLPANGAVGQSISCPFSKHPSDASGKIIEGTGQPSNAACTDGLSAFSLMSAQVPITPVSIVDREVQQDNGTPASQVCDASGSSHAQGSVLDAKGPDFKIPVFAAATMAPPRALQESLHSVMTIVTEALSAAMSMSLQQPTSCTGCGKQKRGGDEQTDGSDVKRMRSEEILSAALQQGLKSACIISAVTKNTDAGGSPQLDNLTHISGMGAVEGASPTGCENVEQKAVLAVAATITTSSRSSDVRFQARNAGLAEQSGGGSVSKDCNCSKPNTSYASPVSHGETESSVPTNPSGNTMGFHIPVLNLPPNLQESSTQTNTGRDKEELPSHTSIFLDNGEGKPSAEAKNVGKLETDTSSVSEDNESNDDCEKFFDELKNQKGWWMLSDSDDSGAL